MPKQRPISTKKRTSQGYRVSVLKRLGRLVRYNMRAEVEAFLVSDYFATAMLGMAQYDRLVTLHAMAEYVRKIGAFAPVPPQRERVGASRQTWGPESRARVRAIAEKFGVRRGLDREIAKTMNIPLAAATLARYKVIGRIRASQATRRPRAGGTHGGRERRPHPTPSANQAGVGKYVSQVR